MDTVTLSGLVLTIVGTIASIWGAVISRQQAQAAKVSADKAEEVRWQLVNQRKTSELAELKVHCERAIKAMDKYGPAAASHSLSGINTENDAKEVQALILQATQHQDAFPKDYVQLFIAKISPLLQSFVDPTQQQQCQLNGNTILMEVSGFLAAVKVALDEKRESTK